MSGPSHVTLIAGLRPLRTNQPNKPNVLNMLNMLNMLNNQNKNPPQPLCGRAKGEAKSNAQRRCLAGAQ
ncbi:hypothetical protein [Lysinibacter cavernae]|uniref:Uncharacterized protein n=1 Tax=Lysinibacter cavernae TaxID=1640652 RepID=A0A7X5QYD2_9MICO|nr:hypothetical protein [Lysinibacter cavernae]NIH52218.1 hypothetical protein [Lysinibacter cavernae]